MRILAFQPRDGAHGGGELVASWMLEALKQDHEVTALCWNPLDVAGLNHYYGTRLDSGDLNFRCIRGPLRALSPVRSRAGVLDFHLQMIAMRYARRVASEYDLAYSGLDEADLGGGGLQYIHSPWIGGAFRVNTLDGIQRAPKRPWQVLSGVSVERIRSNLTLVNSRFTALAVERELGVTPRIVRPPVPGRFTDLPWEDRQDDVVAIGRLTHFKRLDMAIDTVSEARARGATLRLHIVGSTAGIAPAESEAILRLARARDWVQAHVNVSRDELAKLVGRCRYGIHCFDKEPFGIAVAEMVMAGCIPLVRPRGGPVEIVDQDHRLTFDSPAEGAERLIALSRSPQLREEIRERLRARRYEFTPERFVSTIRETVAELTPRA